MSFKAGVKFVAGMAIGAAAIDMLTAAIVAAFDRYGKTVEKPAEAPTEGSPVESVSDVMERVWDGLTQRAREAQDQAVAHAKTGCEDCANAVAQLWPDRVAETMPDQETIPGLDDTDGTIYGKRAE